MKKPKFEAGKAKSLLEDKKSRFYQFVQKNRELETKGRDYIEGEIEELYVFFQSGMDPQWEKRMNTLK